MIKVEVNPKQKEKYFNEQFNNIIQETLSNSKEWHRETTVDYNPDYLTNGLYVLLKFLRTMSLMFYCLFTVKSKMLR